MFLNFLFNAKINSVFKNTIKGLEKMFFLRALIDHLRDPGSNSSIHRVAQEFPLTLVPGV